MKISGHERFLPYYKNRNDYHSYDVHLFWGDLRLSIAQQYYLYHKHYDLVDSADGPVALSLIKPTEFPPGYGFRQTLQEALGEKEEEEVNVDKDKAEDETEEKVEYTPRGTRKSVTKKNSRPEFSVHVEGNA